ncbi:MAG: hypothetical protein JW795_22505 [Chitinivibrionales bacterium]|nr:hypothetical protein [Chitinivibrionales bacterium]
MWILGGDDTSTHKLHDVWYSSDGKAWSQATDSAGWSKRNNHSSLVYKNKLWVLGGATDDEGIKGDVWYTTDGIQWTCATDSAGWKLYGHSSVVFNDKMWVIGGSEGLMYSNDAWYSSDGSHWTKATSPTQWHPRLLHTSVVFNDKIWVIGGEDDTAGFHNDIWYSNTITGILKKPLVQSKKVCIVENPVPNPFQTRMQFSYHLRKNTFVTAVVYNSHGQEIVTLVHGEELPGNHTCTWNGTNSAGSSVRPGVYCLSLSAEGTETRRIVKY